VTLPQAANMRLVSEADGPGRTAPAARREPIITVRGLTVGFGGQTVLDGLDLDVYRGEILGIVGGSGTGKSVLMRSILGLNRKSSGRVTVHGQDLDEADHSERQRIERSWGVLFQNGALFSSLTVKQNIQVPMREHMRMSEGLMDDLARLKIEMVGLQADAADKFPSELSGGMVKRASLARALALDPAIVFLDEPTSGLDPIGAGQFDLLIAKLRDTLGLTVFMVTHDLDSLLTVCDRVAVLFAGKVLTEGPLRHVLTFDHPWIKAYFHGARGRAALE
jgi:phospholipid/cholesterol/gamma-HCH transport system ATP-binding protein